MVHFKIYLKHLSVKMRLENCGDKWFMWVEEEHIIKADNFVQKKCSKFFPVVPSFKLTCNSLVYCKGLYEISDG